jgi:hypothetical protein
MACERRHRLSNCPSVIWALVLERPKPEFPWFTKPISLYAWTFFGLREARLVQIGRYGRSGTGLVRGPQLVAMAPGQLSWSSFGVLNSADQELKLCDLLF